MDHDVGGELAALQRLTVPELLARYAAAFGDTANTKNRAWLVKRLAWRLQARAQGGLSERARQRAAALADDADLRTTAPRLKAPAAPAARAVTVPARFAHDERLPPPGTVLTRKYKGEVLQVKVLQAGFEWRGEVYASLSAVAKAASGSHCNGFLFFNLTARGDHR